MVGILSIWARLADAVSVTESIANRYRIVSLLGTRTGFSAARRSLRRPRTSRSQPQDLLAVVEIGQQRFCRSLMEHSAALEREHAVRQSKDQIAIVLDDQDRHVTAPP